jgi:MFS family permease
MSVATEQPTRSRFVVLALLCTMNLVLYLDRICLSQATTPMRDALGINEAQWSLVAMAFTLAYGIFEVPVGRMGDRHGARRTLTRIVIFWSIFTALTGACWNVWSLIVIRFLFGAGEAGALPNAARVTTNWFPVAERGRYRGPIIACTYAGGAVAPTLTAYLIGWIGWRWNFVVFCSFGILWAGVFYWWFRDTPYEHPRTNDAERELIGPPAHGKVGRHEPIPWGWVLRERNVYFLSGVIICSAFMTYLYFTWYSDYLQTVRNVSPQQAGWLSSLVLTGSTLGVLLGGFLNDRFHLPRHRKWLCAGTTLSGACVFLTGTFTDSPVHMSLLFGASSMCLLCMQPIWWSFTAEVGGKHLGALFGLMNGLGTLGAMASQGFFGLFRGWRKELGYTGRDVADPAFWVYFGVLFGAALCWAMLDTRKLTGERIAKSDS